MKRKSDSLDDGKTQKKPQLAPIFAKRPRGEPKPPLANNPLARARKIDGTTTLATWNVNGLRSAGSREKGYAFRKFVEAEDPDILVLTEVKFPQASTADELEWLKPRYPNRFWAAPGVLDGQCAILSRFEPVTPVVCGFPNWAESTKSEADSRCVTLEFKTCFVVGTYIQNSGQGKQFMGRRRAFNRDFRRYITDLQTKKPVIWTGDFNVIIDENDLEFPSRSWEKKPGCHPEEWEDHKALLKQCDLVDVWRLIHPKEREYSHTSTMLGGWRLDGFLISRSLLPRIKSTEIRHDVHRHFPASSDHWPVNCVVEGAL